MTDKKTDIGTCPFCGGILPAETILLEYVVDNETRVFAECYDCDEPVQPNNCIIERLVASSCTQEQ
ncbi:MAG: hypothetical protein J07HQW2_03733 [Haloquadratum walsbyi J07HQW2]|uniref:DUF7837 domain-containing protein n=1 Tax=Haloquadratum walsbyi J07HQW2 TaxID=1238425 RepID=U1PTV7_9EURY|nr:MAG: hypothetical protein J07HQW2_03733 [Haloquadratum walsbyi J07HQW2]